ncbi:MAG: glycosyltransferase [bacterium]|jgi:glycosyltransferase involved in cell wall biosynthesis|nr:glycosyltransferase [bacterium]
MTGAPHNPSNSAGSDISVSLIIPAFQAESFILQSLERLLAYIQSAPHILEILIVDDGSTDATSERISGYLAKHPGKRIKLITLDQNVGKGEAIRQGVQLVQGDLILFTDCDLPYAFSDLNALIETLKHTRADVVIGSRMHPDSVYHIRSTNLSYIYVRHTSGRLFNAFINLFTRLSMADTQAGLKGFTKSAARICFGKMTVSGFAFDIDLLVCARLNKLAIETVPLNFNYDSEMSTVSFLKHAFLMTMSISHIAVKKLTGHYTRS